MTMLFSKSSPKIPKSGIFGPKFEDFYFCTKLCYKANSRMLTSNMTIFSSYSTKKYANKAFLVQNLDVFIFSWNYADFKYDNTFFNIPVKQENWRISNMTIVISNYSPKICKLSIFLSRFKNFYFATNLAIKQIRGR